MVWGAAPHPGREKFSLHPRHVCDVPKGADAPQRTERAGAKRQTFHDHGHRARGKRATGEAAEKAKPPSL